jgi:hypothetical protein
MAAGGQGQAVPWSWAANSLCSVLGSIGAVGLGITVGFRATLMLAAICYLAGALIARRLR